MADQSVLVKKFDLLHDTLNGELVERYQEVHGVINACIAGEHVFMLGTKGIAKSLLARRLLAYIDDVRLYVTQLNRFMTLEDIFGPLDIPALEQSRYRRVLESYLADAELAMVDEIFECNPSALVAMNTALNERRVRNDRAEVEIPLSTMICASNHLPDDDSTEAMYDRLLVRFVVEPIKERGNFIRMLRLEVPENPDPLLAWSDVEMAKLMASQVEIPLSIDEKLADLRWKLMEEGIEPSDRRFSRCRKLLRAEAWLEGEMVVDPEHLGFLVNVLWDQPEQIATVEKAVLEVSNPQQRELQKKLAAIEGLVKEVDTAVQQGEDGQALGLEIYPKLCRATDEVEELAKTTGRSRRSRDLISACESRLEDSMARLAVGCFGLPPEEIDKMRQQVA